jgi:large-conductance mechanosensitive channel
MFGFSLSPQLGGAVEAFVIVLVAFILFLIVKAVLGVLKEVQDSMSETEQGKRLGAQRKKGIP